MTEAITRTAGMIAGEINLIKEQVRNTALSASVEIGKRLKEARALVPDGEWTEWLLSNVDYSVRTAQNLMALATEFDEGQAKALENLSYTKAVLLLSVPREEREEFAEEHDLSAMSTREMQREIAQLRDRNREMQITMDELIREKADSPAEELKEKITELEGKLKETRAAVNTAKDVNKAAKETEKRLHAELEAAKARTLETEQAARREKEALEEALKNAGSPIIQQVTPPDVEEELKKLRAQVTRSQDEQALRAGYEVLRHSLDRLKEQLNDMARKDEPLALRFRSAFAKGLRLMADGLEAQP